MQTIKIGFCDWYPDFDINNHFLTTVLKQRYQLEICDKPDFLFYSCFGTQFMHHTNCVKIFYTGEAITPIFDDCDYAIGFDYIHFEDRYLRHNRNVPYTAEHALALPNSMAQRKFCNFIYSNGNSGEGTHLRKQFCQQLMKYKHIDCPGKILNNMQDAIEPRFGNWIKGKLDFLQHYKFTIAFENCSKPGYVTEKLMQPLQAHSIPIYWGDPEVDREFNTRAFINCHDYKNFDEVVEVIKYLDTDDAAYMDMLRQPPMREDYVHDPDKVANFLYRIIERGNTPVPKDPRGRWNASNQKIKQLLQEACTLQLQSGNHKKAEEHARLAVCLQPSLQWPYTQLLNIYKATGQDDQLNALREHLIEHLPQHSAACQSLALSLFQAKKYQEAEHLSAQVLAHAPELAWPYKLLSQILSAKGEPVAALEIMQLAIDRDPQDPHLLHHKACLLRAQGQLDEAERLTSAALVIMQHPQFYVTLSRIHCARGAYAQAQEHAAKALALDGSIKSIQDNYTWVLQQFLANYATCTEPETRAIIDALKQHGAFDPRHYTSTYPEAPSTEPVAHYVLFGCEKDYNPTAWFDTSAYRRVYTDVKESGINPFYHYLFHGCMEGRLPCPPLPQDEEHAV